MNKIIILLTIFILFCGIASSFGQTISEEAKRHFDRGMAAVEMAKSPEDYADAIKEFEQAINLAPDWPEVYYNLGLTQEKAEKHGDAVRNLKQYLQLAPNASDAEAVKSLINKLEYKYELIGIDDKNKDGHTPMHEAAIIGDKDKVESLIAKGADINTKDKNGKTPLHDVTGTFRHKEVLELLIAKGADINAKDNDGETPLHQAIGIKVQKEVVEQLIAKGADINAKDKDGNTPLHNAESRG